MQVGFDIIWSNNRLLIPVRNVLKDKKFIGMTNRFGHFTYRLKPVIRTNKKLKGKSVN